MCLQKTLINTSNDGGKLEFPAMKSFADGIPGFTCQMPQGAFYAWPNITGTGLSSQELAHYLLHEVGIACLPGTVFGSGGEGYLRFSYATSIDIISKAIPLIKQAVERLGK